MKYEKEGLKTDVRKLVFNQAIVLFERPATSPNIKSNRKLTLTIQTSLQTWRDRSLSLPLDQDRPLLFSILLKRIVHFNP